MITCPQCGMTSHNSNDEKEAYCGNCHMFHNEMRQQVQCVICGKQFQVSNTQFILMQKIGTITCSHECALKWVIDGY